MHFADVYRDGFSYFRGGKQHDKKIPTRTRTARRVWVRKLLARRYDFGHYDQLLTELHREDPIGYTNYLRITPDLFQEMVEKLTPHLQKQTTFMRLPLEVGLKLAASPLPVFSARVFPFIFSW